MSDTSVRLAVLRARAAEAATRASRPALSVTVLGIAKRIPAARVADAVRAGLTDVGENYLQEALERRLELAKQLADEHVPQPRWHFVGRIQRNKARPIAQHFDVVHTLDRASLGDALERHAAAAERRLDVLIQVNTSGESQKGGVPPEAVDALADAARGWPHLRLVGLMTLPAAFDDPERARPAFRMLRALRDRLEPRHPGLVELSMGMSGDFEVAIDEGATIIRVGTALFGPRDADAAGGG